MNTQMENNKTYTLLLQYIHRKITPQELAELKTHVNQPCNEELEESLYKLWNQNQKQTADTSELDQAFSIIRKKTDPFRAQQIIRTGLKIAAILLLPLLCTLSAYLYIDREQIYQSEKKEVLVTVNRGERAKVILPDGTSVQLNTESSLRYPQSFGRDLRKVTLSGEAFFNVVKNPEKKFIVHTNYLDIEVLGTTFNIYAYENENEVELALLTGQVIVNTHIPPKQTIKVHPNERIRFNKKTNALLLEKTDTRFETAWLRNELVFRSVKIQDVLSKIERRYGVTIHNKKILDENDLFTGRFESNEIKDVMNILKIHYQFNYKLTGEEVWISEKNK